MSESVYILGGGRTDFKRNLKKEGKTIRHIIIEAGKKAIDDAKIDPGAIQAGAVGNFNSGQFTKQLQLGAFIPEIDPKLRGIPTMHTEAACASGALSVLLGAEWIMGGFYDVVLVVGAEQQKTMSSLDGSDVLGAAADYHNEKPEYGDFMFPKLFGRIAQIYLDKYLDKIGRDKKKTPRLLGFGHATDYLPLDKKDAPTFSIARKAAERAFGMANLKPRDINGADVHDCFSVTEVVVYEILGLAEPGKGAELAKSGATALPQVRNEKMKGKFEFELPVNPGGGLIGDGHPVGATGVRQVVEAYQHLTEQAGQRQIPNAKRYLTFNMGGSLTTSVAMLWGRD